MMRARLPGVVSLVLAACQGSQAPPIGDDATSAGTTTGGEQPTTSESTDPLTSSGSTEPGTSTGAASSTGAAEPWIPGPPSVCGPPCDVTWEVPGDVGLGEDDDASTYACVTRIAGSLGMYGPIPPASLAAFANLREIGDGLSLKNNELLTDLAPFACLTDIGRLALDELPALTDASALAGLRSAAEVSLIQTGLPALPTFAADFAGIARLTLLLNPAMTNLDAAAGWPALGRVDINIYSNKALTSVAPLGGWFAARPDDASVRLASLPALQSLAGLEGVRSGTIALNELPLVESLAPLADLTTAESLTLTGLSALPSLQGLGALTTAKWLHLGGCAWGGQEMPGPTSLAGLDSLVTVDDLRLRGLTGLVDLTGAPQLLHVQHLEVVGNPQLNPDDFFAFVAQLAPPVEKQFSIECDE